MNNNSHTACLLLTKLLHITQAKSLIVSREKIFVTVKKIVQKRSGKALNQVTESPGLHCQCGSHHPQWLFTFKLNKN